MQLIFAARRVVTTTEDSALADHCARLQIIFTYLLTYISPLLQGLHWLRVADRITFRLAVLTYRCLNSSALEYLTSQLQRV